MDYPEGSLGAACQELGDAIAELRAEILAALRESWLLRWLVRKMGP